MILTALAALALRALPVDAGCGCNKPPPPAASIRPAFASPGDTVTVFSDDKDFKVGAKMTVVFASGAAAVNVPARVIAKRDLADGQVKPQVVVNAPALPPGPTRVLVKKDPKDRDKDALVAVTSGEFTMLQAPVALAEGDGETIAACYRAAVGADNTVYLPVDISNIAQHMIFSGLGMSYPLLFGASDIAIYNTQGFLMQLLGPAQAGIFAIDDPTGAPNSLELTYDRHEFLTYRDQHAHVGGMGLDPSDPAWHSDGTRHVDHDHLVIAIHGVVENQGPPPPGATPAFDLHITTALADGTTGVLTNRTITWSNECAPSAAPVTTAVTTAVTTTTTTTDSTSGSGSSTSGSGSN
jgi:hypothetical protein